MSPSERRKSLRMGLAIPVKVHGFNADGTSWEELATTEDISAGGASFPIGRPLDLGQVLYLMLPLPKRLRQFDLNDSSYRVYALVRGIQKKGEQIRVGVMFFGKLPPRGFHENPARRYLLPGDSAEAIAMDARPPAPEPPRPPPQAHPAAPAAAAAPPADPDDRRRFPRVQTFVNFVIQQVDEWGAVLQEELTVADNLGKGGAHVLTSLGFAKGDVILVQEAGGGFATRAEIRDVVQERHGVRRLHLKFLDRQAPDRLITA